MSRRQSGAAGVALALILCFTACSRSQSAQSAAPVAGALGRPAAQQSSHPQTPPQTSQLTASAPQASAAVQAQTMPAMLVASDRTQEFMVARHKYRLLIHEQSIAGTTEKTVEWWELRDGDDHVVRREVYPVKVMNGPAFENSTEISGNSFEGKGGSGIIISGMDEPSAPDSGGWMQVFAFKYGRDKYGADPSLFVPFGAPIYVTGDFLGVETDSYHPTPMFKGAVPETVSYDALKFSVWTGNFKITYPVRINWITGHLEPAWRCVETTSKGRIERCSYPVSAEAHREDQATFVRLFPECDDGFTPKHIIIQPQSTVEFVEARVPMGWSEDEKSITFSVNGDMWLKVRIDGAEGWIHSEEDFHAVGLPQAG